MSQKQGCSYERPGSASGWWFTLKSAEFGSSSSLSSLVGEGGGLVFESVDKADLLSFFDSKQSEESVDLTLACHPTPSFTTFDFKTCEVWRHLIDLAVLTNLVCFLLF